MQYVHDMRAGVRRFRFGIFFSVLSETVFAHIFPVSNENENERRTLIRADWWAKANWNIHLGLPANQI